MPYGFRRRAPYNADEPPARPGKPAPAEKQAAPPPTNAGAEQTPEPGYTTAPKWTDSAGKTRTWELRDPEGSHVAEITTRRDAEKLAKLLNEITGQGR